MTVAGVCLCGSPEIKVVCETGGIITSTIITLCFRGYILEQNVKTAETKPLHVVILSLEQFSFGFFKRCYARPGLFSHKSSLSLATVDLRTHLS